MTQRRQAGEGFLVRFVIKIAILVVSGTTSLFLISLFLVWTVVVSVTRLATRPADHTTGLARVTGSVAIAIVSTIVPKASTAATIVGIEVR